MAAEGRAAARRKAPWASSQAIERRFECQHPPAPIEPARFAGMAPILVADGSAMCAGHNEMADAGPI